MVSVEHYACQLDYHSFFLLSYLLSMFESLNL